MSPHARSRSLDFSAAKPVKGIPPSSPSPPHSPSRIRARTSLSPQPPPTSSGLLGRIRLPVRFFRSNLVDSGHGRGGSGGGGGGGGFDRIAKKLRPSHDHVEESQPQRPATTSVGRDPTRSTSLDTTLRSPPSEDTVQEEDDQEREPENELYGRLRLLVAPPEPDGQQQQPPQQQPQLSTVATVAALPEGSDVLFRARIHTQRRLSSALDFLLLRDQTDSIQAVLSDAPADMVRWVQHLPLESLVQVAGQLRRPPDPVRSASHGDVEVAIRTLHVLSAARSVPFDNYRPVPPDLLRHRMANRVLDLRHPSNQAIFRIRNMVTRTFRATLDDAAFIEIHTPKLQPAATESGAQVFRVNYFGRNAFLAQSPQLAKQMAISADFGRVYEIGPVFRAENSNTHRHLTEYTSLDIEMALERSYRELIQVVDRVLKAIFAALQAMPELAVVRERFPSADLVWLHETPIIPFTDGIRMLREDGARVGEDEDLSTRDEIRLGQLVRARHGTDYFILDKFPTAARPFYAKRAADGGGRFTNSFDIFLRGQEICSGGQRIHDPDQLRESMAAHGLTGNGMEEYTSAFEIGAPPHGGAGLGLERIVMLFLELGDVRHATLFHRDPRSLPARPPRLPHPDADTTRQQNYRHHHDQQQQQPPQADVALPLLEDLIANYGDATNTSWLDDRFEIWRHRSGAAVGYVRRHAARQGGRGVVVVAGDPLCDERQYDEVVGAFLQFAHDQLRLSPVWLLVSEAVQEILGRKHGWRTLTCVEEQRVVSDRPGRPPGSPNRELDRKQRRVSREGVRLGEVTQPDEEFRRRADAAIAEWKRSRRGRQVHLTEVRPWVDMRHRRYFAAERAGSDGGSSLLALVVLAQLSPRHGWQVKWALDFPGSTNGAIEVLIERALAAAGGAVTFGAGPSDRLTPGMNLKGARAKFLAKSYRSVAETLGLASKSEFRTKFGAIGEQVFICYPRHGVGIMDLRQIVRFFED